MSTTSTPIGIIAGGGKLPELVIHACRDSHRDLFVIAIEGEAHQPIVYTVPHLIVPIGKIGQMLEAFRIRRIQDVVFAGKVQRPHFKSLAVDLTGAKLLAKITSNSWFGDNNIFNTVMGFLKNEGFNPVGAEQVVKGLLAERGVIGSIQPEETTLHGDVAHGVRIARAIGNLDIGQAVVVASGVVIGVEAVEGTDGLLSRIKAYRHGEEGGVLVKMRRPNQDNKIDLPTIGVNTVSLAHAAGLEGIVIEAHGTLIIDKEEVIAKADAVGMFILGVV